MGGMIGLELAARNPDRISGLLMIDTVLFPSAEFSVTARETASVLEDESLAHCLDRLDPILFLPTDDRGLRAEIVKRMSDTPRHAARLALVGHLIDYDPSSALRALKMPAGYIAACLSLADLARARELSPHLISAQTLGSGHFSQLLVPDQVNAMIETFLGIVDAVTPEHPHPRRR